jgi:chromosome segregation and condensation protein ScpB
VARLKRHGLIAAGPRVAQVGAPLIYVTTPAFSQQLRARVAA